MTDSQEAPPYRGSFLRSTLETAQWHARTNAAEALEPELPIVDAHHHLYGAEHDRHYYRLGDLQTDLAGGHRVVGTVYVEAYESGWRTTGPEALRPVGEVEKIVPATREALALPCCACEVAAGIVAHADLTLGAEVVPVIEAHLAAADGRLSGIRYRTATDDGTVGRFIVNKPRAGLLREATVREGAACLAPFELSLDVWVYHHQLDEVIELADACPATRIVLDHLGGVIGVAEHAAQRDEVWALWRSSLRALALRENVNVKLGGLGMLVYGFGFEHGALPPDAARLARGWKPYIDECIAAFGTRRCMFEGNFPVDKQSCGYTEMWNAYKLATRDFSADERRDLFGATACRVYRLAGLERRLTTREVS
jgi:L-fuconolactonase